MTSRNSSTARIVVKRVNILEVNDCCDKNPSVIDQKIYLQDILKQTPEQMFPLYMVVFITNGFI